MVQPHAQQLLNQKEQPAGQQSASEHYLITATHRLAAALDRLETAVEAALQDDGGGTPESAGQAEQLHFFEQENTALRQDQQRLEADLSELQEQYSDLQRSASAVYSKLDDSIKRLNQILES